MSSLIFATLLSSPALAGGASTPDSASTPSTGSETTVVTPRVRKRKMRPIPALLAGSAAGFGAGYLGSLAHPILGATLTPLASTFAIHPLTDGRFGYTFLGTHVGFLGSAPIGIPIRVAARNESGSGLQTNGPATLALTATFAITSAAGGVIAAALDAKKQRKKGALAVSVTPLVSSQQSGLVLNGRF